LSTEILKNFQLDADECKMFATEPFGDSPDNFGCPDEDATDEYEAEPGADLSLIGTTRDEGWPDEVESWLSECVDSWMNNDGQK
jgi:hypothetical protein